VQSPTRKSAEAAGWKCGERVGRQFPRASRADATETGRNGRRRIGGIRCGATRLGYEVSFTFMGQWMTGLEREPGTGKPPPQSAQAARPDQ